MTDSGAAGPGMIETISALSAAGAAIAAAAQLWLNRRDANRREGLRLLSDVDTALRGMLDNSVEDAQRNVLTRYRGESSGFSEGAKAYLGLLNRLDLATVAVGQGIADRRMVEHHLRTLIVGHVISVTFLQELCDACQDPDVYCDLRKLVEGIPLRGGPPRHLKAP